MKPTKTLSDREAELQALLATPPGRAQLRDLKDHYETDTGKIAPVGKSVISYILACERRKGLIVG